MGRSATAISSMYSAVRSLTIAARNHFPLLFSCGKRHTRFRRKLMAAHLAHGFTVQEAARVPCLHEKPERELDRLIKKQVHGSTDGNHRRSPNRERREKLVQ